ncbi:MAG: hypothetical protein JO046_09545 [Solirubrobacterales bacterium]|nr:hypothetical protein [Solirubrobacterales bacterium]
MLKEMVGDDKINGLRLDCRQRLSIVDDVNRRQVLSVELWVVLSQLRDCHPIHISDDHVRWHRHWQVQGADLDTASAEELGRELTTGISQHRRGRRCTPADREQMVL